MATSNRIRALNRLPFDFEDGLKVGGVDVTNLNQAFTPAGAGLIGFTPVGNLSAGNVQAALAELDNEKVGFARLDDTDGSSLVGYDGGTVQDVMDSAKPMADYVALRAYTGRATSVRITSNGLSGFFYRDDADTTSLDNGGTIIVAGNGKRWKRLFDGAVNVKWFGAKGNGSDNDTDPIQRAVNFCIAVRAQLVIPPTNSSYLINAVGSGGTPNADGGIIVNGPILMYLYGATLKAITTSSPSYVILNIRNANNVFVYGGSILGERTTHTGVGGEQGHGIVITGSSDIRIQDTYVKDCWGDGIGIRTDANPTNRRITLDNVTCDSARRNGLTVQLVDGLFVTKSKFINTNGTAPQAGVDIEPNPGEGASKNVIFQNCYFSSNAAYDIVGNGDSGGLENVTVSDCIFADTLATAITFVGSVLCNNVLVTNNTISMRSGSGLGIAIGTSSNIKILNNNVTRAGAYDTDQSSGLYVSGTSINVILRSNSIKGFRQGIQLNSTTLGYAVVENNEVVSCARGLLTNSPVSNLVFQNNTFRDLLSYGIQAGFVDSVISGNTFEDVDLRAMLIGATNCEISKNVFNRVGTNDQVNEPCMSFSTAAENCTITNNTFYSATASQDAIRAIIAPTAPSYFSNNVARYGTFFEVFQLHSTHVIGRNIANASTSGSFTLNAASARTVLNSNVLTTSKIHITPTNASAATLLSGSKNLYVSAKTAFTSFTVSTADGTAAVGDETFDYEIINW